ncbi:MAG: NUDIX hydrolase [Xanthomonadales bacterium]|nr:NUDIX hydrolase [Xanthomonadales bacterium]
MSIMLSLDATDPRSPLLADLQTLATEWPEEAARIQRFTDFIRAHENCAGRELTVGHLTGSAWLVDPTGSQVLLTHHRKLQRWLQLGGHADGKLDIAAAALREAQEESGLEGLQLVDRHPFAIDDHRIPARGSEPEHTHYDICYVVRATAELQPVLSEESLDLRWWPIAQLCDHDEAFLARMARRWLSLNPSAAG